MLKTYERIAEARDRLKDIYDSAREGVPSVVRRASDPAVAVVRVDSLKRALRALCPIDPQVRFDDRSVSIWLPGFPVSAEALDFDEAAAAFVDALRDYAELWAEDLRRYPNHEENWGLANLVLLSDDEELRRHVFGED